MDLKKIVQTSGFGSTNNYNKNANEDTSLPISGIRRRNGPQNLRSPAAKRPLSAPVTHQGWLHKQGSEGLMLWKKRWFVLCEYCLFYYKGPEEEKLLGSILLPSYTITICKPDEKVNRKFAFHAEHTNMRTYHFAADSRESMNQWINVLTLASLLQDPSPETRNLNAVESEVFDRSSKTRQSKAAEQNCEMNDAEFHGFNQITHNSAPKAANPNYYTYSTNEPIQKANSNFNSTIAHQHSTNYGLSYPNVQYNQIPLRPNENQFANYSHHQHFYQHPATNNYVMIPTRKSQPIYANSLSKTKVNNETRYSNANSTWGKKNVNPANYESNDGIYDTKSAQPMLRVDKLGLNYAHNLNQQSERRTPDTYSRSNKTKVDNGDYEDVYTGTHLNQHFSQKSVEFGDENKQQQENSIGNTKQLRSPHPPRPHSADFLEHEVMKRSTQSSTNQFDHLQQAKKNHPQRPKSSIDIVNPHDTSTNDNYFYSEEYYAAQMRQRTAYLHQSSQVQQRNEALSCAISSRSLPRDTVDDKPENAKIDYPYIAKKQSPQNYRYPQQQATLTKSQKADRFSRDNINMRRSLRERNYGENMEQEFSDTESARLPARVSRGDYADSGTMKYGSKGGGDGGGLSHNKHNRKLKDQWFTRSASARFPTNRSTLFDNDEEDYVTKSTGHNLCEGERKREESMKRLLEWKQRMLQSPLTRKPSSTSSGSATHNDLMTYYKQPVTLDLTRDFKTSSIRQSRPRDDKFQPHVRSKSSDGRRLTNVITYESDSSDDEDLDARPCRPSKSAPVKNSKNFSKVESLNAVSFENLPQKLDHQHHQSDEDWKSSEPSKMTSKPSTSSLEAPLKETPEDSELPPDATKNSLLSKRPKGILKSSSSNPTNLHSSYDSTDLCSSPLDYPEPSKLPKYVQWTSSMSKKKQWDSKIDEQDVIKEFSYQYINPAIISEEVKDEQREKIEIINNVQSMIKSFELANASLKEVLKMEKPLKISSLQATEAHISRLDSSQTRTDFTFGDSYFPNPSKKLEEEEEEDEEENLNSVKNISIRDKSVKDLLADFEKKSKQLIEEHNKKQEKSQRGVLSDTEMLLYDTGSDLDEVVKSSEDEEGMDLEDGHLKSDYAETIKRKNDLTKKRRRRKTLKMSMFAEAMLAESEKSLKRSEQLEDTNFYLNEDKMEIEMEDKMVCSSKEVIENIYLPMNPRKAILNPENEEENSMQRLFANLSPEESSYVEMTRRGLTHSLLAPNSKDEDTFNYTPHYEFVCVADNVIEPVYMEVHNFEKDSTEPKSQSQFGGSEVSEGESVMRSDLPDILNNLKSDSSDADDESSKDLDSIGTPRHPRFSLSDTFRPASYYLGASQTLMTEMQDSSDSDLVSPPPIPTSPPSMDDLDSLEMQELSSERKKKKGRNGVISEESGLEMKYSPKMSLGLGSRGNNKKGLESSMKLMNAEEMNHQLLKRRPVSSELCEVLDILDQLKTSNEEDNEGDFHSEDKFQEQQKGKMEKERFETLFQEQKVITKTNSVSSLPSMKVSDSLPCHQHSLSFTGDSHYENVKSFSPLRNTLQNIITAEGQSRDELSEKSSTITSLSYQNFESMKGLSLMMLSQLQNQQYDSQESLKCSVSSTYKSSSNMDINFAEPQNSNLDSSAPYYYSDLRSQAELSESLRLSNQVNELNDIYSLYPQSDSNLNDSNLNDSSLKDPNLKSEEENVVEKAKELDSHQSLPTSHRRSRSLEGLLDDVGLQNLIGHQVASAQVSPAKESKTADSASNTWTKKCSFDGEDPWEQDSLWRESLRTVSLRHAKSLDNLDNSKIHQLAKEAKQTRSEEKPKPVETCTKHAGTSLNKKQCKRIYYKLNDADQMPQMRHCGKMEPSKKTSFELDREKLRQWDLLSSACLLQEQQQANFESTKALLEEASNFGNDNESISHFIQQQMEINRRSGNEWMLKPDALYKK